MPYETNPFDAVNPPPKKKRRGGNPYGQIIRANDAEGHTVAECWELLFIVNASLPAPFKWTDEELSMRVRELFPERDWVKLTDRPHVYRNAYNNGSLPPQRRRNHGQNTPPTEDFWSYQYVRISNDLLLEQGQDVPPYEVYAFTPRPRRPLYRVFPPDLDVRYQQLKGVLFKIPKQDWNRFPYPKVAENLWKEIRKERLAKEREAWEAFAKDWIKKQRALRPGDFDPTLWKDPEW